MYYSGANLERGNDIYIQKIIGGNIIAYLTIIKLLPFINYNRKSFFGIVTPLLLTKD